MLTAIEKVAYLQDIEWFKNTDTQNLLLIAVIAQEVYFEADAVIYQAGKPSDALYLVIDGEIQLENKQGQVQTVQYLDSFGMLDLLNNEPHAYTAKAFTNSLLFKIERDNFWSILAGDVGILQSILKTLAHRVQQLGQKLSIVTDL